MPWCGGGEMSTTPIYTYIYIHIYIYIYISIYIYIRAGGAH